MISFTQGQTLFGQLSQNTSSENMVLYGRLANIEHRYLLQKYFSNEGSFTMPTVAQQQFYSMPPNYSKLKTVNITVGTLQWTPIEVLTREEWDRLNVFPYYSDIPTNFFIYPGGDHGARIGIFPIPSSSSNTITFNYKFRIPDLSVADYTTPGTVSVTTLTTAVSGTSTTFAPTVNAQSESRWIQFSQPSGDNLWYQISSVASTTALTLYGAYQGSTITASSTFTIGQMPLLMEDFQDMLVWKALVYYFTSIVDNKGKRDQYEGLYGEKMKMLEDYAGSKTTQVNLARHPTLMNPNLFQQSIG